jgi:hyaluronan synthase
VSDQLTLETTSTASSLVPPAPSRRRYARSPLDSTAQLKSVPHKTWQKIRVVDISENGARIECQDDMRLSVGESIILNIPSLPGRPQKNVVLRGTVHRDYLSYRFGVSFDALVNEQIDNRAARGSRILAVSAALLAATAILYLKSRNVTSYWYGPLIQTYSIMAAIYLMSRVVISAFYKAPRDNGYTPTVSLIVAVKNEEAHIAETVAHCFRTRYPVDKFELIVVDDGSTDDTWKVLTDLQKKYDSRFRCFQFPENRGKRHAMALGTRVAKGDFLVFIDSDTFLEEEAIYRLVQPFHDPRVGAVAGHTLVIVEEGNIISKMESVRYFVSQRIMKAAESVFNAVTCCPGPLSGYRKAAVLPLLDQWENQMFLGVRSTFGDDRSLTNFILRNYRVVYHAGARCATYTPSQLSAFIRQQLRWKKSWIREFTIAARFMWQKHPVAAISYYASSVITLISPLIAFAALFGLPFIGVPFNFVGCAKFYKQIKSFVYYFVYLGFWFIYFVNYNNSF